MYALIFLKFRVIYRIVNWALSAFGSAFSFVIELPYDDLSHHLKYIQIKRAGTAVQPAMSRCGLLGSPACCSEPLYSNDRQGFVIMMDKIPDCSDMILDLF